MKRFIRRYWLLIVSLIYLIWPFDFIADVFGPFGLIDDFAILMAAVVREIIIYLQNRPKQ